MMETMIICPSQQLQQPADHITITFDADVNGDVDDVDYGDDIDTDAVHAIANTNTIIDLYRQEMIDLEYEIFFLEEDIRHIIHAKKEIMQHKTIDQLYLKEQNDDIYNTILLYL